MLQILLAVIGMTMAGALGYAMLQQASAQAAITNLQEDSRRIDMAAAAVTRALVDVPPTVVMAAPVGTAGASYYELPSSLNVLNTNSSGVRFHYCPVAGLNQQADVGSTNTATTTANIAGGGNYNITTYMGGVIGDTMALDASVRAAGVVAIITSANKGSSTPPPCSSVTMGGGRAIVPGGLARVVTLPSNVGSTKQSLKTTVAYYVSQSGSGDKTGKDASNTAPADGVWKTLYRTRPAAATIYVFGTVAAGPNFSPYLSSDRLRGIDITFVGLNGANANLNVGEWYVYSSITFAGMSIQGSFVSAAGGHLQFQGVNRIYTTFASANPINTIVGGRTTLKNAELAVDPQGKAVNGVMHNSGETTFINSSIVLAGSSYHYLVTYDTGLTILDSAFIGRTPSLGASRVDGPLYVIGRGRLMSSNSKILRGHAGVCFGNGADEPIRWSPNSPGTTAGIVNEGSYPPPAVNAGEAAWSQYRADVASRARSREQFIGNVSCVEDS